MGSGTLSVQFEALPPPVVTGMTIGGGGTLSGALCVWTNASQLAVMNCTVGVSPLRFSGSYMFDLTFTVGGVPLTVDYLNPVSARSAYMHMPYSASFVPNQPYDLVITNGNGLNLTYPGYVSFTSATNIAFIDDCRDVGVQDSVAYTNCLAGDTLSMTVNNVPAGQPAFTVTIVSADEGNSTCTNPQYASSTKLACTVPLRTTAAASWDALLVQWASGASMWVPSRFYIYDDIGACPHHCCHGLRRSQQRQPHPHTVWRRRDADVDRPALPHIQLQHRHRRSTAILLQQPSALQQPAHIQ